MSSKKPGRPKALAPKDHIVPVRLTANGLRLLDEVRGGVPRSVFMRNLLKQHLEKGQHR